MYGMYVCMKLLVHTHRLLTASCFLPSLLFSAPPPPEKKKRENSRAKSIISSLHHTERGERHRLAGFLIDLFHSLCQLPHFLFSSLFFFSFLCSLLADWSINNQYPARHGARAPPPPGWYPVAGRRYQKSCRTSFATSLSQRVLPSLPYCHCLPWRRPRPSAPVRPLRPAHFHYLRLVPASWRVPRPSPDQWRQ